MEVIYEDNHIIVVNKRPGEIVQGDKTGDRPLVDIVKEYLKGKYQKPAWVIGSTARCGGSWYSPRPPRLWQG